MTYPYFKICTYGNLSDLSSWSEHFKRLSIPYAITRKKVGQRDDRYDYALWRMGLEVMSRENVNYEPNNEPIDGEMIEIWGGFRHE